MGVGFGAGSSLAGALVGSNGAYITAFRVAALMAAGGTAVSAWGLRQVRPLRRDEGREPAPGWRLRAIFVPMLEALHNRPLLAGSILNALKSAWFVVVGGGFLSLYMANNGISAEAIGLIFGLRSITSSAARLPAGLLTRRWPSYWIIVAATAVAMLGFWLLPLMTSIWALTLYLAVEGAMFGALMSVGNTFVTENSTPRNLGSALGLYGTVGGAGSTLTSLLVGLVAEWSGLPTMFMFMGAVLALGTVLSLWVRGSGQRQHA